jgi:ssDNA-binding Zn-finger/Zn-ribbon topoisomerase 1
MIRLKLNLPEATVSYNETGALLGCPVDHTPNQIKNFSLPFEISGYVSKNDFLAYSLFSSARKFSISEQISLLTQLGFKTVPYFENEEGQGNQLITLKNQYSMYDAIWISLPTGTEYKIPELAHINSVKWKIGADKALTLECTTDKGIYDVVDMRMIAYYQPGCTAKVWNGELQPMNTAPVVEPIPPICPKCSNPLKRIQIYPDLPMFYKCTNSICDQMVLDEEPVGNVQDEPEVVAEPESFPKEVHESVANDEIEAPVEQEVEDEIPEEVKAEAFEEETTETVLKCFVDTAKVDAEAVDKLVEAGKIVVVDEIDQADCVLVKTKMSVSKNARNLSKEFDKELKPITDFE